MICLPVSNNILLTLHCQDIPTQLFFTSFFDTLLHQLAKDYLPGASVRNPARDKVMRKEADIRKACSDFRDPSGNS